MGCIRANGQRVPFMGYTEKYWSSGIYCTKNTPKLESELLATLALRGEVQGCWGRRCAIDDERRRLFILVTGLRHPQAAKAKAVSPVLDGPTICKQPPSSRASEGARERRAGCREGGAWRGDQVAFPWGQGRCRRGRLTPPQASAPRSGIAASRAPCDCSAVRRCTALRSGSDSGYWKQKPRKPPIARSWPSRSLLQTPLPCPPTPLTTPPRRVTRGSVSTSTSLATACAAWSQCPARMRLQARGISKASTFFYKKPI